MSAQNIETLFKEAEAVKGTNPAKAEQIYRSVLDESVNDQKTSASGKEQKLRDQEAALIKLGELFRDTK